MGALTAVLLAAQEAGTGTTAETVKPHNPILPATNEMVWGALSFLILFFVIAKFGYPAIKKSMDARAERIKSTIDDADRVKNEADTILADYQRQLADAKGESARIIEEARQAADKLRQDLKAQAETEVAEIRQRAQEDIRAERDRVLASLRAEVADMAIRAAEKVVEKSLDRETNLALIESFINQTRTPAG